MAENANWVDIGSADELSKTPLRRASVQNREFAVSFKDGKFGVVANSCNHAGGPLGDGRLDGEYIVCPWHNWKFHRCSGLGEPGFEDDRIPAFAIKVESGRVLVDVASATKRNRKPSREDMEHNVDIVRNSAELAEGAAMLSMRCLNLAKHLIAQGEAPTSIERGGRKAHALHMDETG